MSLLAERYSLLTGSLPPHSHFVDFTSQTKESYGSLLELTWNGTEDVPLKDGTTRKFLEDGDTLNMTGYCESSEGWRIGFGECVGTILPANNC